MRKKSQRTVTETVVESVQIVEFRFAVAFNEMAGTVTWPTLHAVAGVMAADAESLGHSVDGVWVRRIGGYMIDADPAFGVSENSPNTEADDGT